jgi:predicted transcriptional regulator
MNVTILIDAIVRQTTVLIAQLSTAAGLRAPLAHVANQVFLDLVHQLKDQGLGNKVIADMFGIALSTYHHKVRRLSESHSVRGRSLWEATLVHIQEHGAVSHGELLQRFQRDDEASVRGVLLDLVESGLVLRGGRGDRAIYRAAELEELTPSEGASGDVGSINLLWLAVHRNGPANLEQIAQVVPFERGVLEGMLEELVEDGRVQRSEQGNETRYSAADCVLPLGEPGGWEAALFDHYQAMVTTICEKLRRGQPRALDTDRVGGSTYGFTVWPGHPEHDEVLGLLARQRKELSTLRARVRAHNSVHPAPQRRAQVIAYVGQTLIETVEENQA